MENEIILPIPKKVKDITGQRFGRLVAVGFVGGEEHARWLFKCDCGNEVVFASRDVRGNGRRYKTVSCGCYKRDRAHGLNLKHGGRCKDNWERLYTVWHSIQTRCYDESDKGYKNYGARGIKMCDEWRNDYAAFREWALTNGYDPKAKSHDCTIERIDNGGDYCPENCKWVTAKVQARNRRTNHLLTFCGREATISEWAEETGINKSTISNRIKCGWSVEDALTMKAERGRRYCYD